MQLPVYLDYAATTPVDPLVLEAMWPYFTQQFGNASARTYTRGRQAAAAVETARAQVAAVLSAEPGEILFTSGATEAVNLALKGVLGTYGPGSHLVTVQTEHSAVLQTCRYLEQQGATVTYLPVDADGQIRLPELEAAITPRTVLIAIMAVNNETGVMQPLEAIGAIARAHNVLFFSDAAQAFGKLPLHVQQQSIDLLSLSAHKLCGPQGVGALYVRRKQPRVKLAAQAHGGGQEHGLRSGTLNLPGIVGLGKAAALCAELQPAEQERFAAFRQMLCDALVPAGGVVNGRGDVLPQILSLRFPGRLATGLLHDLQGRIDLTTGSACSSASLQPSHVLKAMGLTDEEARSTLRLSMGRFTTEADMAAAIGYLRAALHAQPPL